MPNSVVGVCGSWKLGCRLSWTFVIPWSTLGGGTRRRWSPQKSLSLVGHSISSGLAEAVTGYSRKKRLEQDPFCLELLRETKKKKQQFVDFSRIRLAQTEKAIWIMSSKKLICLKAEAGMQSWKLSSLQNLVSESFLSVKNLYNFYSGTFFLLKLPTGIIIFKQ